MIDVSRAARPGMVDISQAARPGMIDVSRAARPGIGVATTSVALGSPVVSVRGRR